MPRKKTTAAVPASIDLMDELRKGLAAAPAPTPPLPERLRTQSDEVSELRGALIAMLWDIVGGETDQSCDGHCEERGDNRTNPEWGTPFPACAAVRALDWAEHFDAKAFEQRASR
jgi:hypothetical protein